MALTVMTLLLPTWARAQAQQIDIYLNPAIPGFGDYSGVTVGSRLRPDYDYPGVKFDGFIVDPEVSGSAGYDSNVTGTSQPHGSTLLETQGAITATSHWGRNSLGGGITVDDKDFLQLQSQSYTNWTASLGGTYEIGHDVLAFGYTHLNLNQTPRDLDVPQLDSPIAFRIDDAHLSYKAVFGRVSLQPGIELARYTYDNGMVGQLPYTQTDRDRFVVTPNLVATYEVAPLTSLVAVVSDSTAHYTNPQMGAAPLGFNDLSALVGVNYNTGGPIRLRALVGYETRSFESRQFSTISAPIIETSAIWAPTGLTTITATVSRAIEDSASETTVGLTETAVKLSIDHEYLRNVLLNASGTLYFDSYRQNQGSQSYYALGTGVTWLLNRHMRLLVRYDYASRQSDLANGFDSGLGLGGSYTDNRFMLQFKIGL